MVNEKMTALADEIRELSGTTTPKSLDAMTSDVGAANAEIAEQTDLLEQIATALEGKASGGGSGSVETCTVTFDHMDTLGVQIVATVVENGVETIYTTVGDYIPGIHDYPITIQNVKCGSALVFEIFDDFMTPSDRVVETSGGASVVKFYRSSSVDVLGYYTTTIVIKAPTIASANGTVNIM